MQLKSINEWIDYISNKLPEYNPKPNEVPDDPQLIYKREWKGIEDWLGIKGDIKSFLQNLEFTSNYFDGYRQKLPSYKYKISKKQLKKYSTISNTITDERIHKMITNLDFKNFSTEIIGQFLDADNMYSKYHKNLLANPTISFETKLNFILINEKNNGKKILEFIHYLDINVSEIPQVEKIINTFEQTQDTLQYTPNIKDIKRSNIIIMKLKIKLQYLIYKKTGKPAVVSK